MPPGPVTPEHLRARATSLRSLANKLDHSAALDLHLRAGSDVWEGATPRQCHQELLSARAIVLSAAGDLRLGARFLEDRADQIAASAASPPSAGFTNTVSVS